MKDWLLIPLVLGFFLLGWPLMGKLDRFLDKSRSAHRTTPLRLSVEKAVMTPDLTRCLDQFSIEHPEVDLLVSCGQRQQLIRDLSMDKLDLVLVYPTGEAAPSGLNAQPVDLPCGGVPVCDEPVRLELISRSAGQEAAGLLGRFLTPAS